MGRASGAADIYVDFMNGFSKGFGIFLDSFFRHRFSLRFQQGIWSLQCFYVRLLQARGANRAYRIQNLLVNREYYFLEFFDDLFDNL